MDIHSILGLAFIVVLTFTLYAFRERLTINKILGPVLYFAMWRTRLGLKQMEWGKTWLRKPIRALGYAGVAVGFLGMLFVTVEVVLATAELILRPEAAPSLQPVLPIAAKGVFFVPFIYWIISIFVIAAIHEFAHGIVARAHDIPIKSSGFAFLGALVPLIPAAFVEPDEKNLPKKPAAAQLSLFAAGAFANVLTAAALVFLFALPVIVPHSVTKYTSIYDVTEAGTELYTLNGLNITEVKPGSPAEKAGIQPGQVVTKFDDIAIDDAEKITAALKDTKPGQTITLTTNNTQYAITLAEDPDQPGRGVMGVGFKAVTDENPAAIEKYGRTGFAARVFLSNLAIWIFTLSLGIGIFNLIPLGPIDGGRMFHLVATRWLPRRGHALWKWTSAILLGMIIVNLAVGWLR